MKNIPINNTTNLDIEFNQQGGMKGDPKKQNRNQPGYECINPDADRPSNVCKRMTNGPYSNLGDCLRPCKQKQYKH